VADALDVFASGDSDDVRAAFTHALAALTDVELPSERDTPITPHLRTASPLEAARAQLEEQGLAIETLWAGVAFFGVHARFGRSAPAFAEHHHAPASVKAAYAKARGHAATGRIISRIHGIQQRWNEPLFYHHFDAAGVRLPRIPGIGFLEQLHKLAALPSLSLDDVLVQLPVFLEKYLPTLRYAEANEQLQAASPREVVIGDLKEFIARRTKRQGDPDIFYREPAKRTRLHGAGTRRTWSAGPQHSDESISDGHSVEHSDDEDSSEHSVEHPREDDLHLSQFDSSGGGDTDLDLDDEVHPSHLEEDSDQDSQEDPRNEDFRLSQLGPDSDCESIEGLHSDNIDLLHLSPGGRPFLDLPDDNDKDDNDRQSSIATDQSLLEMFDQTPKFHFKRIAQAKTALHSAELKSETAQETLNKVRKTIELDYKVKPTVAALCDALKVAQQGVDKLVKRRKIIEHALRTMADADDNAADEDLDQVCTVKLDDKGLDALCRKRGATLEGLTSQLEQLEAAISAEGLAATAAFTAKQVHNTVMVEFQHYQHAVARVGMDADYSKLAGAESD
jgi:hypothetical protein